jgi:hypothetical protein
MLSSGLSKSASRRTNSVRPRSRRTAHGGECWEWRGARSADGYGQRRIGGKLLYLHRLAYEWAAGAIPAGMLVCHRCDNPPCCNPDHLFLGSRADNARDMCRKGRNVAQQKTHCPSGHALSGSNLLVETYRRNGALARCRRCKTCRAEQQHRRWAA